MEDITRLLRGDQEGLLEVVYEQLREIAAARMSQEAPGHSLQATALVHEAYARLMAGQDQDWRNRGHFFRASAEAMRRILIDHARKKKSEKRGGRRGRTPLEGLDLGADYDPIRVLELHEALETLADEDPQAAEVVQLRFFAGLDMAATARSLGISERSAARDWAWARARLFSLLEPEAE
ncbi:MAG: ECF-type sigma factor [Planctomycetota bacterium]